MPARYVPLMRQSLIILTFIIVSCSQPAAKQTILSSKDQTDTPKTNRKSTATPRLFDCLNVNLSRQFTISVFVDNKTDNLEQSDSFFVAIALLSKDRRTPFDTIMTDAEIRSDEMYVNCNNYRSYSTGLNARQPITDNYYGDIIVADFNFDRKDDIAVLTSSGGNGGPTYSFYLQGDHHDFQIDKFLTDSLSYFPSEINTRKMQLTTMAHAGATLTEKHTVRRIKNKQTWLTTERLILETSKSSGT